MATSRTTTLVTRRGRGLKRRPAPRQLTYLERMRLAPRVHTPAALRPPPVVTPLAAASAVVPELDERVCRALLRGRL